MKTAVVIIMLGAAVAMIWAMAKYRAGCIWGRKVATACAFVALCGAIGHVFIRSDSGRLHTILEKERAYRKISAQKLGAYLASNYAGARAVIVVQPKFPDDVAAPGPPPVNTYQDALLEGLKAGFGDQITVVAEAAPEMPEQVKMALQASRAPGPGNAPRPPDPMLLRPEFWLTTATFNDLVAEYKDQCDLIVSTIGLPPDLRGLSLWDMSPQPRLAILSGSVYELRPVISSGQVTAAVTLNPGYVYSENEKVPADLEEAFANRFLLLTAENVNQVAAEFGRLFPN